MSHFPTIAKLMSNQGVKQGQSFSFNLIDAFDPQDGSLKFSISGEIEPWLQIKNGELCGQAPDVSHDKFFKIIVKASNDYGHALQSFILRVICTDVVENILPTLIFDHNLKHEKYGYVHIHPYTPELLEILYYYYEQKEYQEAFEQSLKEAAQKVKHKLPEKITYEAFRELINKINPDAENVIKDNLRQDHEILQQSLDNEELQRMFRQGSAPAGAIEIPVWNHLGTPQLFNWSNWEIYDFVLGAAGLSYKRMQESNLEHKVIEDQNQAKANQTKSAEAVNNPVNVNKVDLNLEKINEEKFSAEEKIRNDSVESKLGPTPPASHLDPKLILTPPK